MNKKLLSILALLLAVCSGAWAQTTLLTYTTQSTAPTAKTDITAGSGYIQAGSAFSPDGTNYGWKLDGDPSGTKAGSKYVFAKLATGTTFQVGDKINISGYSSSSASTDKPQGFSLYNNDGSTTYTQYGHAINTTSAKNTVFNVEYEVKTGCALIGQNTVYVWRYWPSGDKGTSVFFTGITITRPASKTVTSTALTGITINGNSWDIANLSDNAASISTEYAGPPTVQFIYTENYSDNTSTTGKTQNIVAVKNGANYVATSTALTTNANLTFTNVSNVLFSMTNPTAPTSTLAKKTSSDVTATFSPGGSAIIYNGHNDNGCVMVDGNGINLAGSGNSYFKASFPAALAEGDVIDCSNHSGTFYVYHTNSKSNSQTLPYTIPANSDFIGKKYVYVLKNGASTFTSFTITRPKTISTQELGGVKEGSTTLTETTDYTVSSTTITLTDAHKAVVAPTNIKLINHITFDDASTENRDVDVTLAKNGDYFKGTATIGATAYTVKVPVDASTPLLSLSAASGSITLNSFTPTGTAKVTVTGANLTNGTFNAPTADGVTVTPASVEITDGSFNQEFTITSTATTAASTELSFEYTGAETKTYTLTYSKTAMGTLEQTDVTAATTWDWNKAGEFGSNELTNTTSPANSDYFLMANMPEITGTDASFNKQALMVMCQFPTRGSDHYFQGTVIKFNVTVPGTVQVWFSNTSNRTDTPTNRRFLYVNGKNSGVYTLNQTFTNTEAMFVPKGEVVINAFTGDDTPASTMVRINKIVFTPATSIPASIGSYGYASFSTTVPVDFTNVNNATAWIVTGGDTEKVTLEQVTGTVAANTGLILKSIDGGAAEVSIPVAESGDSQNDNKLFACDGTWSTVGVANSGTNFVLTVQNEKVVFAPVTDANHTATLAAGQAALWLSVTMPTTARGLSLVFGEETTGVSDATRLMNNDESIKNGEVYNLSGQRVAQPSQGLYIIDGKKVIIK